MNPNSTLLKGIPFDEIDRITYACYDDIDDQLDGLYFSSHEILSCRMMTCGETTLAAFMAFRLAQCGTLSKPGASDMPGVQVFGALKYLSPLFHHVSSGCFAATCPFIVGHLVALIKALS